MYGIANLIFYMVTDGKSYIIMHFCHEDLFTYVQTVNTWNVPACGYPE